LFVELDDLEHVPVDTVGGEKVGEELRNDAEAVGFEAVDGFIVMCEAFLKEVGPHAVELTEPLADHAVEFFVGPLLTGTLHNHGRELTLEAMGEVDAHELMTAFFKTAAALDGEVNCAAQTDKIGVSLVFDIHGFFFLILLILRRCITVAVLVTALLFSQDLSLDFLVLGLMCFVVRVQLEDVETVFDLEVILKRVSMRNLILFLDEIQLLADSRIVLVLGAPDLKQHLDHVLSALVNVGLVENVAHLVEDGIGNGGVHVVEEGADLLHDANGDLDRVVRRLVE